MKPRHFLEAPENAKEIRPLRDYLVLRPLEKPGMIGALFLPDVKSLDAKNGLMAEVIAAGPECGADKFWKVQAGDTVHVAAYGTTAAGMKLKLNGETVILIRARDVNGVVQKVA